jgi:hypothetical protein
VWGFLGHGPREYHIALSEALSEAAVASLCDWLRLFSPAAGQHPKCRAAGSDSDQDPPAQRLAAAAIPSPGAGSDSDTRLSGYSQAPGGPEFDKSESCAVHWQSNLSEWSRPAVDGLTILLSGGDRDTAAVNTAMPVGTVTGLAVDHRTLKLRSTAARVHTRRHTRPLAPDQYSGASAPQVPTRTGVPQ